ncbi:MAG: RtcB family protein [Candidatus Marinimicrobia bacterium]|nr:RtcB family protein [Candidatus Neomarinimicrobiota bacterium]
MDLKRLKQLSEFAWQVNPSGDRTLPGIIYADSALIRGMDEKVCEQVINVTALPGLVRAVYAMPDAHWGYGFPIGGVAAFDPAQGGVISAGGVGFDIACGVRTLHTGLVPDDILAIRKQLADQIARDIPAGIGSRGKIHLNRKQMNAMLSGGARWAVEQNYGTPSDLGRIEENGQMAGADPACVSDHAKKRQQDEMGTLGSGNHYLEIQQVTEIFDAKIAAIFGIREGDIKISIHCGSRGLGHQIGTEFLKRMVIAAPRHGLKLTDRELACAPINSNLGQEYFGAMNAGINCALANRQILTHLIRQIFERLLPQAELTLLYDVAHNTCKRERHRINGKEKNLYVHRKGATRAFGPGHPDLPEDLRSAGQPVLIGGTMGTASYILAGSTGSEVKAFSSACHGAGRTMSRIKARKIWRGQQVIQELARSGIEVRSPSYRGVAEEAPGAYKDVSAVVDVTERAGLSKKVARLVPMVVIKG